MIAKKLILRSDKLEWEYEDITQLNIFGNSITITGKCVLLDSDRFNSIVTDRHYLSNMTSMSVEF